VIDWLLEPLRHTFMQHAFLAIVLVGVICGVTGVFVTLRGLAFMGDALSHAIFPGVVIAYLLGGNFLIGALIAAIVVSLGIGAISQNSRLSGDTAIGVLFAGAFALGIALISAQRTYTRDLASFLLGSILGVSRSDLWLTAGVGAVVLATIALFRRELTIVAFDRTFATATGINVWLFDQLFLVLLSLAIVVSLQTVGNILVLAMLITPAATARLLTDRLRWMVLLSAAIGAGSGVIGLYASYHLAIASGASVVLVATILFGLVFVFSPSSGVATVALRRRAHYPHPERDAFLDGVSTSATFVEPQAEPSPIGEGQAPSSRTSPGLRL
jgi:ABC-type Mn2+/Zn2+ transport system permease subunit